ncbi:hypothetical protein [uncultured Alistipes sp.]|uniref:hypothetical protein n=1 Tax=uncultured Alistipes sp. TaxID=538949 RepID=UPI0025D2DF95|nr:hypothetical protein [uncultured Alistipes sp.]
MKFLKFTIFVSLIALLACLTSCSDDDEKDVRIQFDALTADGGAKEMTSKLTLTFSKEIKDLSANDITLDAGQTGAEKGALTSKGGGAYELALSGIAASGNVTVQIEKPGFAVLPVSKTVPVYYYVKTSVDFVELAANGAAKEMTTKLTLTFSDDIAGLKADDITINAGQTGTTKGALTKVADATGKYELAVTGITQNGDISVKVEAEDYIITPDSKEVGVFYYLATSVSFDSLTADGTGTTTTTKLTLQFDKDVQGFSASSITLDAGTTGATKGALTKVSGSTGKYELAVSGITASGTVKATVALEDHIFTPEFKEVQVKYAKSVGFAGLKADGGAKAMTTKLTLEFNADVTGLSASDITLTSTTGATKGVVTDKGEGFYELTVTGITQSGQVTVAVNKDGYSFSPTSKQVGVFFYETIPVAFQSLTADGSATATTSKLTFQFDKDITGFTADNITLQTPTGATKGALTKVGTGKYELALTGIVTAGTVRATVAVEDHVFTPEYKDVNVKYVKNVTFTGLTANGSVSELTTKLMLEFGHEVTGLSASDITLGGATGATKGTLTDKGEGDFELTVTGITQSGQVTVTVAKTGFVFTPNNKSVSVFYVNPVVFSDLTTDGNETTSSTKVMWQFDKTIGFSSTDITLDAGTTGATKGYVSSLGNGKYELMLNNITSSGQIKLTLSKDGYSFTPNAKTVQIYKIVPVAFNSLTADGSSQMTTKKLTLTFNKDIPGLTVDDITLDAGTTGGTQKTTLTKVSGTGKYELGLSGINMSGSITVGLNKAGYPATPATQSVQIYKAVEVDFRSLTANGSASTGTTTELYLELSQVVSQMFDADNITLDPGTTGAVKGTLAYTGAGTTYKLTVSGITQSGNVLVSIHKDGHQFTPMTRQVAVTYSTVAVEFQDATSNGNWSEKTTRITLQFSQDIPGLSADDFTLSYSSSNGVVNKGALTKLAGTGKYQLAVSNTGNAVYVRVEVVKAGYTFDPYYISQVVVY